MKKSRTEECAHKEKKRGDENYDKTGHWILFDQKKLVTL